MLFLPCHKGKSSLWFRGQRAKPNSQAKHQTSPFVPPCHFSAPMANGPTPDVISWGNWLLYLNPAVSRIDPSCSGSLVLLGPLPRANLDKWVGKPTCQSPYINVTSDDWHVGGPTYLLKVSLLGRWVEHSESEGLGNLSPSRYCWTTVPIIPGHAG